jgi:hypothetical protein
VSASRWIRIDTTWSQSEWVAALEPEARLAWVELLCHVKAHGYAGSVKRLPANVAARLWALRVTAVTQMEEAAIADQALVIDDGEWVITGWSARQSDPKAADRMKRYRERQQRDTPSATVTDVTRNGRNVTATTPTETETETEQHSSAKKRPTYTSDFQQLWDVCKRGSRKQAFDQYHKARASKGIAHDLLLAKWKAHVQAASEPEYVAHLFRWLRDERWEEDAHVSASGNGKRPDVSWLDGLK